MVKGKKQRVLVGLSGGVDSAVSAYLLLKAGYEVEGAFMKNWSATAGLKLAECPWLADRQEALRVAAFLGIPLHTLDFEKEYQDKVMSYFFAEYKAGRTPNPDVMCNKEIKFKLLYDWAMSRGFDFLATGHYAQIAPSSVIARRLGDEAISLLNSRLPRRSQGLPPRNDGKGYQLIRSVDSFKDQTYFIYNINTEQLPHVLFPIGGMKKPEVKKLAEKIGLPNAKRKESMGLCFVGKVRLKEFLEQEVKAKPGPIMLVLSAKGLGLSKEKNGSALALSAQPSNLLGKHQGLHTYTIGQRQGISIGGPGGPYYVVRKDLKTNTLFVTNDPNNPALEISEVVLHSVNWITKPVPSAQYLVHSKNTKHSLSARYRHQGELVPCTVEQTGDDEYVVRFKTPQKAVASGQSVVLYDGKVCLGGGVIV